APWAVVRAPRPYRAGCLLHVCGRGLSDSWNAVREGARAEHHARLRAAGRAGSRDGLQERPRRHAGLHFLKREASGMRGASMFFAAAVLLATAGANPAAPAAGRS